VKLKAILVMKHVLESGNPHFQICLQRQSEELRPCLNYRGPPDPLHGDTPYRLVRDNAQIVLNMCFETRNKEETNKKYTQISNTSQNISNTNFPGYDRDDPYREPLSNYENDYQQNQRFNYRGPTSIQSPYQKTFPMEKKGFFDEILETAKQGIGFIKENLDKLDKTKQNQQYLQDILQYPPYPNNFQNDMNERRFGNLGGNTHTIEDPNNLNNYQGDLDTSKPMGGWDNMDSSPSIDVKYESGESVIVNDLCKMSGVRVVPSHAQVTEFIEQVKQKDIGLICQLLSEKLDDKNWKIKIKALHGIIALLKQNSEIVKIFFEEQTQIEKLNNLNNSVQKSVKDKATQILNILTPPKNDTVNNQNEDITLVESKESNETNLTENIQDNHDTEPHEIETNGTTISSPENISQEIENDGSSKELFGGLVINEEETISI